jgi:hypothetical protein
MSIETSPATERLGPEAPRPDFVVASFAWL